MATPKTITRQELVEHVLDKPRVGHGLFNYTLRKLYSNGKIKIDPNVLEEIGHYYSDDFKKDYHRKKIQLVREADPITLDELIVNELKKSQVQRHPKQFGITGTLLATVGIFAVAAAVMVGLELGASVGVWAALTGAMPFLAVLGTGVPALLALSAIFAAIVLVGYGVGVIATHFATREHPQVDENGLDVPPPYISNRKIFKDLAGNPHELPQAPQTPTFASNASRPLFSENLAPASAFPRSSSCEFI